MPYTLKIGNRTIYTDSKTFGHISNQLCISDEKHIILTQDRIDELDRAYRAFKQLKNYVDHNSGIERIPIFHRFINAVIAIFKK